MRSPSNDYPLAVRERSRLVAMLAVSQFLFSSGACSSTDTAGGGNAQPKEDARSNGSGGRDSTRDSTVTPREAKGGAAGRDSATLDSPLGPPVAEAGATSGCTPGEILPPPTDGFAWCSGAYCSCDESVYASDAGLLRVFPSTDPVRVPDSEVVDIKLSAPLGAGQPVALSIQVTNNGFRGDVELWGADAQCGAGLERFMSEPIASKVYCVTVQPQASYTHLLFVTRFTGRASTAGMKYENAMVCPAGRCL